MTSINPYEPPQIGSATSRPVRLPVRVSGVLTAEDAIESLRAVGKWRTWLVPLVVAPTLLLIGGLILLTWPIVVDWRLPVALGVFALVMMLTPIRARQRFRKQWKARPEHHQPIVWTFSPDDLLIEATNSKHLHAWTGFIYAKITPDKLILAQQGGAMFNFIPRRFFETEDDWVAVCDLLSNKLPVR
jgi:hypothetical protein